jgi:hypothetical protein
MNPGKVAETIFYSIKRTFGEHVTARKFHNMVHRKGKVDGSSPSEFSIKALLIICGLRDGF